jgi:hypothetical protein
MSPGRDPASAGICPPVCPPVGFAPARPPVALIPACPAWPPVALAPPRPPVPSPGSVRQEMSASQDSESE